PRVAVITGASSGIGEATARLLAGDGWRCVLLARREDRLRPLAEELGGEYELLDVADREAVDRVAAAVLERHPRIGLLMNNPGFVETEGFPQATTLKNALFRRAVIGPDKVARHIHGLVGRAPSETFIPGFYRPLALLQALLPGTVGRVAARSGYRPSAS